MVPIKILYIGDFDPSGLDIERAARRGETKEEWIARRIQEGKTDKQSHQPKDGLADYLEKHFGWEPGRFETQVEWRRIGVTEDDWRSIPDRARVPVKEDSVDENGERKKGDPRADAFIAKYGEYGAEVEALEVVQRGGLAERLEAAIQSYIDPVAWEESKQREESDR